MKIAVGQVRIGDNHSQESGEEAMPPLLCLPRLLKSQRTLTVMIMNIHSIGAFKVLLDDNWARHLLLETDRVVAAGYLTACFEEDDSGS